MTETQATELTQDNVFATDRLAKAERIIKEIWDTFYGQNLEVAGWHKNGDTEKMDTFFEDNDWIL